MAQGGGRIGGIGFDHAADPVASIRRIANPTIRNGAGTSGIGHYFITASAAEAASIDIGGSGPGWARTGRTFRAWVDLAKAPEGAVGVCRFYARVPNSHFYTANVAECQSLRNQNPTNDANLGWSYEGIAFYTVPPIGGVCAAGYHPVYRSYNNRFNANPVLNDGNHRITPSYNDYQRSIRFFGYVDEGVAFCSPASTNPGGDLQVTYSFPGATVQAGAPITAEFLFGNNGAGKGDGGSIYLALPAEVTNWSVTCTARNGTSCPGTSDLSSLSHGTIIANWPAGGTLSFSATGTAPQVTTGGDATLRFVTMVANASGSPDANPGNDMPSPAQTVVKAAAVCNTVPNPMALRLGPAAQSAHVGLIIGTDCPWSAQSDASWLTVNAISGTGDTTLTLAIAQNTATSERTGAVNINGQIVTVAQSGTQAIPGLACDTFNLQPGDGGQVPASGYTEAQSFNVVTGPGCTWSAISNTPSWITLTDGTGGSGNGTVRYRVGEYNDVLDRSGSISVGTKVFTINQAGRNETENNGGGGGGGGGGDGGGDSGGNSG